MYIFNPRKILFSIVFIALSALIYAFYAQYVQNQEPCPLCIVERIIVGVIGACALAFALHNPKTRLMNIYGGVLTLLSLAGMRVGLHHWHLTQLPFDQKPTSCGAPMAFLFEHMPVGDFVNTVMKGDTSCANITWKIWGVNPPVAVMILCGVLALLSIVLVFANCCRKSQHI